MSIEVLLAGNQNRLGEVENLFALWTYPYSFAVKRYRPEDSIGDRLGATVIFFCVQNASEQNELIELLEICNGRVNVVVECRLDSGELALKWVCLGAFWVIPEAQWASRERLATIIIAAGSSRESRSQLFQDLNSVSEQDALSAASRRLSCFVSMNLRDGHEDRNAYESALRPLGNYLSADIKLAIDHADSGYQGLRERIAGHIQAADICIAFLSPTGRMTERDFLWKLLSHIPYLRSVSQKHLRNGSSIEDFGAESLAELLEYSGEIDRSCLFLQSPSVMWEIGFAFALRKTIVFLSKCEYVGVTISPPAMTVGSYRVEFENHIDLALRLYFGLKQRPI